MEKIKISEIRTKLLFKLRDEEMVNNIVTISKERLMIESYNIIKHDPIYNGASGDNIILFRWLLHKVLLSL